MGNYINVIKNLGFHHKNQKKKLKSKTIPLPEFKLNVSEEIYDIV